MHFGGVQFPIGDHGAAQGTVTLGLRAEDLRLATRGEASVALRIDHIEELGAQRLIHGLMGDQNLTLALSPSEPLSDTLAVHIPPQRLHVFDTVTGQRIAGRDAEVTASQSVSAWGVK